MPKEMSFEERIRLPKDIWSSLSQALSTFKRGRPSHRSIFLLALFTTLFSTLSFAMEPGEDKAQVIEDADTPMQSFCRVTLGGDRRSGRSSFVSALKGEAFNVNRQSTPGIEVSRILRNGIQYSVWDHGVSSVSRAYDRMYLAHHGVYLVVFDMMKLVPGESEIAVQTALSYLEIWICDIQEYSLQQPPVVFLVGTHRDKIKDEDGSQLKAIDDLLRQKFGSHPAFQNAQRPTEGEAIDLCFFPLSNRNGLNDSMLQHLIRKMDHFVTSSNPLENTTYVLPLINKIIRNHGLQDAIGDREINDRRRYGESYGELKWKAKLEPRLLDLLWKDHKKELRDSSISSSALSLSSFL
jgi:GTPase SAR1 family protein